MKRALLSIAALSLVATTGFAQITIADTDFGNFAGATDRQIKTAASTYIQFPVADHINNPRPTGYTWSIQSLYADTANVSNNIYTRHVAYTGYDHADSIVDGFGTTYTFSSKIANNFTPGGLIQDKQHITKKWYSLGSLPNGNNATDSLVVLEQDAIYYNPSLIANPSPRIALKFPLQVSPATTWNNGYYYKVKATISYVNGGYQDDTLERRRYINESYIVIGHGSMKARVHWGGPNNPFSDLFNVLQVRVNNIQTVDSFFLNNVALTQAQLTLLGMNITQGQTTQVYRDHFYRTGEVIPMVDVHYTDAARGTVQDLPADRSLIHANRLTPSGVNGVTLNNNYAIFPNPVKAGATLVVDLKDNMANGNWSYNIINVTGQQVATGNLNLNAGKASITLPKVIAGIYYIQASNGDQKIVKALDIE